MASILTAKVAGISALAAVALIGGAFAISSTLAGAQTPTPTPPAQTAPATPVTPINPATPATPQDDGTGQAPSDGTQRRAPSQDGTRPEGECNKPGAGTAPDGSATPPGASSFSGSRGGTRG